MRRLLFCVNVLVSEYLLWFKNISWPEMGAVSCALQMILSSSHAVYNKCNIINILLLADSYERKFYAQWPVPFYEGNTLLRYVYIRFWTWHPITFYTTLPLIETSLDLTWLHISLVYCYLLFSSSVKSIIAAWWVIISSYKAGPILSSDWEHCLIVMVLESYTMHVGRRNVV